MTSVESQAALEAAALQQALAGGAHLSGQTLLERERRLSEMILQLQLVREQLLAQQDHAKVGANTIKGWEDFDDRIM